MEQTKLVAMIMACVAVLICGILLIVFEHKRITTKKLMLVTVMTAMSIAGRLVFFAAPGFKPVTAIVIITGMYLGIDAGFYCGALTALISNFYFGQGTFTPFQMLTWGLIGVIAGLFSTTLKKNKVILVVYAAFSGILFSVLMDIYTVIWTFGHFEWGLYVATLGTSLSFTIIYAVSNVIFILALSKPIGYKIEHAYKNNI